MNDLLPDVRMVSVQRLLRDYFNQISMNFELFEHDDISKQELKELSLAVDKIYATKITNAVLE